MQFLNLFNDAVQHNLCHLRNRQQSDVAPLFIF
jgi:hypothetical protein